MEKTGGKIIDKEKMLKFLESEMKDALTPNNYIAGMKWIYYVVEKGTFDVKSEDQV